MLLLLCVDKHHLFRVVYSFYDYKRCIEDTFDANGKYVNNLLSSKETFVEMRENELRSKINISICQLQIVKNIKSNIIIILYSKCTKRLFWQFSRSPKFPFFSSCDNHGEYKNCFYIRFFAYLFSETHLANKCFLIKTYHWRWFTEP